MSKSKATKKKNKAAAVALSSDKRQTDASPSPAELWAELSKNRLGVVGFGLSMLQLVMHAAWLIFAAWLSSTGRAKILQPNDWEMWLIAGLGITGAMLTMISLFMCLYAALQGNPKTLALIGLSLSFFIGMLTTFVLVLQASAPR